MDFIGFLIALVLVAVVCSLVHVSRAYYIRDIVDRINHVAVGTVMLAILTGYYAAIYSISLAAVIGVVGFVALLVATGTSDEDAFLRRFIYRCHCGCDDCRR